MSLESTIPFITTSALLAAIAMGLHTAVRSVGHRRHRLRWMAFWLTIVVSIALAPVTVADSGMAALYLLGVPVIAAAIPVLADVTGVARVAADAVGAAGMIGWAWLLALGIGTAFLAGAFLLLTVSVIDLMPKQSSAT